MRLDQLQQLPGRSAESIELGHDHDVARHQLRHKLGKLRPIGPDTTDFLAVDRLSASGLERVKLAGQVLVPGADPGVAEDSHFDLQFRK